MGSAAQIPTSFGHELRACLRCRLVKTYDQFRESGCENCPFFEMAEDPERVVECTTPNFTGDAISVMKVKVKNFDHTRFTWSPREGVHVCILLEADNVIISVMDPTRSWAARWLRIGKFQPGCYTLAVSEALSEEMQNICEDNRVQYVPPKRV